MRGINLWIGMGNLTRDPELRYTQSGQAVANAGLACNETWMKDGEKQERVHFMDLVFWGQVAETVAQHCEKGSGLYVQGSLQTREWEDREGNPRKTTECTVREFRFVGGKGEREEAPDAPPPAPEAAF